MRDLEAERLWMVLGWALAGTVAAGRSITVSSLPEETIERVRARGLPELSSVEGPRAKEIVISWTEDGKICWKNVIMPPNPELGLAAHRMYDSARKAGMRRLDSAWAAEQAEGLSEQAAEIYQQLVIDGSDPVTARVLTETLGEPS